MDALGAVFHRSYHLGLLAGIHAQLGDTAAGQHALEEAYGEVARTEVRLFEAELRRIEGELQLLAGAPKAGEACFVEALAVARRQDARSFELRAATRLARLWQRTGRRIEARDLLAPIYDWFTEGFDTPDLRDARVLLDSLG